MSRELQNINSSGELTELRLGSTADGNKVLKSDEVDAKIAIDSTEASTLGLTVITTGGDKGLKMLDGEIALGSPATPHELVVGSGDSYLVGTFNSVAYHCEFANFTGTTVTGATDITAIVGSETGSSTGLFNGTTVGKTILVGSDYPFGGAKVNIVTAMVDGGNLTAEYLRDGTPTWVTAAYMATLSDFPYTQYGEEICNADGTSEQIRFGFDPDDLPSTWAATEMTINGVASTKYWGRFRITSPITTDAVVEQFKLHTNRWECNGDGTTEYFGNSRFPRSLVVSEYPNADKNPTNENILFASGITALRVDNEFNDNANDGFIIQGKIPVGLDTSIPVQIEVDWYQNGTNTGDVELELEVLKVTNGFLYNGAATASTPISMITTVDGTRYKKHTTIFKFLVDDMLVGNTVVGSLYRDAAVGNPDDTLADSVVIVDFRMVGYFWR